MFLNFIIIIEYKFAIEMKNCVFFCIKKFKCFMIKSYLQKFEIGCCHMKSFWLLAMACTCCVFEVNNFTLISNHLGLVKGCGQVPIFEGG